MVRVSTALIAPPANNPGATERSASFIPAEMAGSPRRAAPRQMKSVLAARVRMNTSVQAGRSATASTLRSSSPDCQTSIAAAVPTESNAADERGRRGDGAVDGGAFHQQADGVQVFLGSAFGHDGITL